MNRPKLTEDKDMLEHIYKLELYCDELESEFANLKTELLRYKDANYCLANLCDERNETIQDLVNRDFDNSQYRAKMGEIILELRKNFDTACSVLHDKDINWLLEHPGNANCVRSKEEWKETIEKGIVNND